MRLHTLYYHSEFVRIRIRRIVLHSKFNQKLREHVLSLVRVFQWRNFDN